MKFFLKKSNIVTQFLNRTTTQNKFLAIHCEPQSMFNGLTRSNKKILLPSNMNLKHVLCWLLVTILMTSGGSLKVIFARNATARAERLAEAERIAKQRESPTDMSTIINVPTSCKPGFVYESQFHNRCRRVAG